METTLAFPADLHFPEKGQEVCSSQGWGKLYFILSLALCRGIRRHLVLAELPLL